jgi:hypothetical protein
VTGQRLRTTLAAALLGCFAVAASTRAAQMAALYVIPTESESAEPIAAGAPARVRLFSSNAVGVAKALGVSVPAGSASLDYVIDHYPQLRGAEGRTWLESTFVVDFTEPDFEPLRKELGDTSKPTRAELVAFVARILEEGGDRGWDIASVVARRRQGDCTEHAVLTAALARLRGIPARVAVGVALVSGETTHGAFGHAWAELLENGEWKVADAALLDAPAAVRYLPMGLLEDEGMGYTMDLARLMTNWIDRVVVIGPAK